MDEHLVAANVLDKVPGFATFAIESLTPQILQTVIVAAIGRDVIIDILRAMKNLIGEEASIAKRSFLAFLFDNENVISSSIRARIPPRVLSVLSDLRTDVHFQKHLPKLNQYFMFLLKSAKCI